MSNNQLALDLVQETNNNEEESKGTTKLRKKSNAQRMGIDDVIASYDIQPPKFAHYLSKRDLSYNFKSASGEIADNAFEAGADKLVVLFEGLRKKVETIVYMDNGIGMDFDELLGSYDLGAGRQKPNRTKKALGKFGHGGILGSLALAAAKETYTRAQEAGNFIGRGYNLEHLRVVDGWASRTIIVDQHYINLFKETFGENSTGTIIVLKDLDKLRTREARYLASQLLGHFSERYNQLMLLTDLEIMVDDKLVEPKDPLYWNDSNTIRLLDEKLKYHGVEYTIRAVDLHKVEEAEKIRTGAKAGLLSYSGLSKQLAQGGYFYRNNAMIEMAVTNDKKFDGFYTRHDSVGNLRWMVQYDAELDDAMGTSSLKNGIDLEQGLKDQITGKVKTLSENMRKQFNARKTSSTETTRQESLEQADAIMNNPVIKPRKAKRKTSSNSEAETVAIASTLSIDKTKDSTPESPPKFVHVEKDLGVRGVPFMLDSDGVTMVINVSHPWVQEVYVGGTEKERKNFLLREGCQVAAEMEVMEMKEIKDPNIRYELILDKLSTKLRAATML